MKYFLKDIALVYTRGFNDFLNSVKMLDKDEAYLLFSYSIKKIYGIETSEFNSVISEYGERCINYLSNLKGVPKKDDKLSLKEKLSIADFCCGYWVASDIIKEV